MLLDQIEGFTPVSSRDRLITEGIKEIAQHSPHTFIIIHNQDPFAFHVLMFLSPPHTPTLSNLTWVTE
jgi:hypothetical protein